MGEKNDLWTVVEAMCNHSVRAMENGVHLMQPMCELQMDTPCARDACPVLAAAERVVERLECQTFTEGIRFAADKGEPGGGE